MTEAHILAAVLATWRIVELVQNDTIAAPIREIRFFKSVIKCHRCISVWAGLITVVLFWVYPWANWPFAFSMTYIIQHAVASRLLR